MMLQKYEKTEKNHGKVGEKSSWCSSWLEHKTDMKECYLTGFVGKKFMDFSPR